MGFNGFSSEVIQNEDLDSLLLKIESATSEKNRFEALLEISEALEEENMDTAVYFALSAETLAEKKNWKLQSAQAKRQIGWLLCTKEYLDSGMAYLNEAKEIFSSLGEDQETFTTQLHRADAYSMLSKNKEAIEAYVDVLKYESKVEIQDSIQALIFNNLGLAYQYTGSFDKALEYELKSLKIKERLGHQSGIARTHDNLGLIYFEIKDYEKAMFHYNQGLAIYKELKDTINMLRRSYAIGGGFYGLGKYEEARLYLEQAVETAEKYNHIPTIVNAYQVLGLIHLKKDEFEEAEKMLLAAEEKFPKTGPPRMLVFVKSNLSVLYLNWGTDVKTNRVEHLTKAAALSKETEEICQENSLLLMQKKSTEVLYKAYKELGQYEKALDYSIKYMALNDSLLTEQKQNAMVEMEEKYQAEKKDLEIDLLSKDKAIKEIKLVNGELEREKQQRLIYVLLSVAVLIALLGLILYRFYNQKRKTNKELVAQNEVILKQKEENETLLKEIHHRVKNNMQIISSLLDLQSRGKQDESAVAAIQEGQNRVQAMSLIHEMLYQNENMAEINIHDYIHKLFQQILQLNNHIGQKINPKINVASNIHLNLDIAIPLGLILTELLTNSFKYAFQKMEKGEIRVDLKPQNESEYVLEVSDNGIGLPEDLDVGKVKSLGLRLVKTLTKQIQGSMGYKRNEGALFHITFPKEIKLNEV
jgi:two-component sensor histidine kinase/Tfp pilus assembly protein PilF